jgi:hypothetical protein
VRLITGGVQAGAPDGLNSELRGNHSSQPSVSLISGGAQDHGVTDSGGHKIGILDWWKVKKE